MFCLVCLFYHHGNKIWHISFDVIPNTNQAYKQLSSANTNQAYKTNSFLFLICRSVDRGVFHIETSSNYRATLTKL